MRAAVVGLLLLLGGCDRVFQLGQVDDRPTGSDGGGTLADGPVDGSAPCTTFGAWGLPVRLPVSAIGFDDYAPTLTADNRRLIFHSERAPGGPFEAIWAAGAPGFGLPQQLSVPSYSLGPFVSADGLQLWFHGYPTQSADILTARRTSLTEPFTSTVPVPGLAEVGLEEKDIAFTPDLLTAVLVVGSGNDAQVAIADRPTVDDDFATVSYVDAATNTGLYDCCPTISPDGLTLLWEGNQNPFGIWQVTRSSRGEQFSNPTPFVGVDVNADNGDPQFSYDGSRLVYAANTNEEEPDFDIYMLERTCATD